MLESVISLTKTKIYNSFFSHNDAYISKKAYLLSAFIHKIARVMTTHIDPLN